MTLRDRVLHSSTRLDEEVATRFSTGDPTLHPVQVHPPNTGEHPTVERTVRGLLEFQSKWLGTRNTSPRGVFEIHRPSPENVVLQYLLPTARLERKLRTQLKSEMPDVQFSTGTTELPLEPGTTLGGGYLTTGRRDWYPLRTEFDTPPLNAVVSLLHRHAVRDSRFVVQILFKPVSGRPLRNWYWTRRAYQQIGYLRKEKEKLWNSRSPTPREKSQADAIERKAGSPRFHVSIRLLVVGAGEYTPSRVKELSGGFNVYENLDTGQYLDTVTVRGFRSKPFIEFGEAVAKRTFAGSLRFQASLSELAGLVSLPEPRQDNVREGNP